MAIWLVLCPVLFAGAAFAVPCERWRPWLVPLGAAMHLALVVLCLQQPEVTAFHHWLQLDPLGKIFLLFISVFFLICASYTPGYLAHDHKRSNRALCACLLLSLGTMTLVIVSHHLGLMWIAVEATTLSTAPCIYFNHNPRSLEATWKYLLICSVGIALALMGSFFLAYASLFSGVHSTLLFDDLVHLAPKLDVRWLHVAFVLTLVGYGTKMGLAPMHTWLPDAHSESPALVSALLSGALLNCAFLGILRIFQICYAAGEGPYARRMLLFIGLFSMAVAAVSMSRQRDIKRIVAYSSVEHMGMLAFGIGVGGGTAVFAALLHVIHNGMTKGWLFLAAGNIYHAFGTKDTDKLNGALRRVPFSGWMFLLGFLAITGSPPFGPFVSEFQLIVASFADQHYWAGGLFLVFLLLVFIGMGYTVFGISLGKPAQLESDRGFQDRFGTGFPILLYMSLILLLGVYNPPFLSTMLHDAAAFLEAQ